MNRKSQSDDRWAEAQAAEAEYWANTSHSAYQALFELTEHYRQAAEKLEGVLAGKTQLAAVEIGVGPMGIGFLQVYAAGHCGRIVGVEPLAIQPLAIADAALADYMHALRGRAEIVRCKAEQLPMEAGTFDLGCCINVIDHTDRPWTVLAELARVVRPGGLLVLAVHTRSALGLCKWQIDRRLHAKDLFYRAHPHAFTFHTVAAKLDRDWQTLWCDRPGLRGRLLGHQAMSTWILRRRAAGD